MALIPYKDGVYIHEETKKELVLDLMFWNNVKVEQTATIDGFDVIILNRGCSRGRFIDSLKRHNLQKTFFDMYSTSNNESKEESDSEPPPLTDPPY